MIRSARPVVAGPARRARPLLALALVLATGSVLAQTDETGATGPSDPAVADASPPSGPEPTPPGATPPPASPDATHASMPEADEAAADGPPGAAAENRPPGTPPVDPATAPPPADAAPVTGSVSEVAGDAVAADPDATAAEADFAELYGDPAAGSPTPPAVFDPWERYNRRMHRFNNAVDRRVASPLARAYVRAVPRPVRTGVSNFFNNLGQPLSAVNALLQGKPRQAAHSLGRFVVNSTLGIGGVLDPASDARLQNRSEDFGQTLGVWGWKRSRYVELPLFGPRTVRDVVGMAGDAPLSPLRQIQADRVRVPLQGLQLVDLRMQLMSTDALREGAEDDYILVRDAWSQRRAYQIDGDAANGELPDYLQLDPGMVPVDAMPVGGG